MKINLYLKLFLPAYAFTLCSCSHEIFSGVRQITPVKIDARINDWEIPLRFYDDKTKLNYSVTNDENNLYLCMRATDMQTQMKITQAGMQVWLDTTGKNKHSIGISFPLSTGVKMKYGEQTGSDSPNSDITDKHDRLKMRNDFLAANKEMQVTGFKPPLAGFIPLHSDTGINLSMNWDSTNTLIYEAKIPFSTFYKKRLTPSDSMKVFSIGIFVNGVEIISPTSRSGGGGDASGGGMNGGGLGGSGMGNGRLAGNGFAGAGTRGGGANSYGSLTKTKSVWTRFKLSVPHPSDVSRKKAALRNHLLNSQSINKPLEEK